MMTNSKEIPDILSRIPLDGIVRIDAGLEGDWSPSVATVWSRESGFVGFSNVIRSHPSHNPSLELYFDGAWLGIHCHTRINGKNVFDETFARRIIEFVEKSLGQ
jgi:hypothetical protein